MLQLSAASLSDVGRKRSGNEDAFHVDGDLRLYIVSDGMGGHAAGEVASRLAVDTATEVVSAERALLARIEAGERDRSSLVELAKRALKTAAERVYAQATSPGGNAGMGCTLTLALVAGGSVAMAHVGDSRLYLSRGGEISQLSNDHTVAAELAHAGLLKAEDIAEHPFAHTLSRAVGTQPSVKVDTLRLELLPGDRLLLCSDGFSNYLDEPASLATRLAGDDLDTVVKQLVDDANEAGGSDNITVVLVAVSAVEPQQARTSAIEIRYDALGSVFLFDDLDLPLLARVMGYCKRESHEADTVVVDEGDEINELFIVTVGHYELHRDGKVVGSLRAGNHAGATSLLASRPAGATLVAVDKSRLLRLHGRDLSRLVRQRPWLGLGLLERLGRQLSTDLERSFADRSGKPRASAHGERM